MIVNNVAVMALPLFIIVVHNNVCRACFSALNYYTMVYKSLKKKCWYTQCKTNCYSMFGSLTIGFKVVCCLRGLKRLIRLGIPFNLIRFSLLQQICQCLSLFGIFINVFLIESNRGMTLIPSWFLVSSFPFSSYPVVG